MFFYMGLFLLVIAVSLDGFGVGMTYGMRRIRVPFAALLIIMLCSGVIVLISMTVGTYITLFISASIAEALGGAILIAIGLFCLINIVRTRFYDEAFIQDQHEILRSSKIGKYKSVLAKPQHADLDHSGSISVSEALLLGSALAFDAFGAGIGAAMLGYSPIVTASLIAVMSGVFVYSGIQSGIFLSANKSMQKLTFLPPLFLIALGIFNIF
ncbi:sporulation membrane protein YtaF [Virgibacillus phasianinus]|uniref:Sporulation membrane protein YtaF n=2 Tax=Virgibacillus phasianinus TaxID=2017483 RepID=A0A220U3L0_9BACI|nr:sporulation membrane protein YtaF [Virgibacillus phasianinus]ASK62635.1 sporulation membrane protein YtaF [Virgibacillus phasianinus]